MAQSQGLLNSRTDLLSTRLIDFNGRQIKNAGDAIDNQDYVTLSQVGSLISKAIPKTLTTSININGKIQAGQPGAILFVGSQGQLSQDSTNFNYDASTHRLDTVAINVSGLTISRPVKTDTSKNLISGLIILTSDVSGILPIANGGSGLAAVTAGYLLIGAGTAPLVMEPTIPDANMPLVGPGAGTYTVGLKLNPLGNDGTITIDDYGRVTAIQQAT